MKKTFTGTVKEIIQSLFELEQDRKYTIEIKRFRKRKSKEELLKKLEEFEVEK